MILVELHVSDLERAMGFYQRLGLEAIGRGTDWAELAVADGRLRLTSDAYVRSHPHYFTPHLDRRPRGLGVEICVEVQEPVDEVAARMRPTGAVVRDLVDRPWGARDFRVADPDGYFVRVTTALASRTTTTTHISAPTPEEDSR